MVAFAVTFGAYVVMLVHATARPHHVTYLCFAPDPLRARAVPCGRDRARDGSGGSRWCSSRGPNLHGGVRRGLRADRALPRRPSWSGGAWGHRRRDAAGAPRRSQGSRAAALVATLANPYGWRLHLHIREYLGYQTATLFSEFQSPQFHLGQVCETTFEAGRRRDGPPARLRGRARLPLATGLALAYFLGQGLQSSRHMVLFAIAAAADARPPRDRPAADGAPRAHRGRRGRPSVRSARSAATGCGLPIAAVAFVGLSFRGEPWFRREIVGLRVSAGAVDYIRAHPADFSRMFNGEGHRRERSRTRLWPDVKIYIDDRLNGYGERFFREKLPPDRRSRLVVAVGARPERRHVGGGESIRPIRGAPGASRRTGGRRTPTRRASSTSAGRRFRRPPVSSGVASLGAPRRRATLALRLDSRC